MADRGTPGAAAVETRSRSTIATRTGCLSISLLPGCASPRMILLCDNSKVGRGFGGTPPAPRSGPGTGITRIRARHAAGGLRPGDPGRAGDGRPNRAACARLDEGGSTPLRAVGLPGRGGGAGLWHRSRLRREERGAARPPGPPGREQRRVRLPNLPKRPDRNRALRGPHVDTDRRPHKHLPVASPSPGVHRDDAAVTGRAEPAVLRLLARQYQAGGPSGVVAELQPHHPALCPAWADG